MSNLSCKHCGGELKAENQECPSCGIPLAPDHAESRQKRFIIFFIALVIFCGAMVLLVPHFD
ncbi:MAG: hypothetical protein KAH03_00930 [Cocleimonas sp.]|nr:hypothetical protein [Cocleimonas sp.]